MEDGDDYYEKECVYVNGNKKMACATANLGNDQIKFIITGTDRATRKFMNDNFTPFLI